MTTNDNHATFTLKLTGIDLENIHPSDIGILTAEFARLLDNNNLTFGEIRTGSAIITLGADTILYPQILENFSINTIKPAYKKIQKTIRKLADTFPNIQAQFLARPNSQSENQVICTINYIEEIKHISQPETLIGKLTKPAQGKDDTDHFTILLSNDNSVSVKVSKELSNALAEHLGKLWLAESLIEFNGIAKYEVSGFQMTLKEFTANHFEIIANTQNLNEWANDFMAFGESGWQKLDNPLETWIEERH